MNKRSLARAGQNYKGYSRLFAAGIINGMGDRFSGIAILALVLEVTGSGMAVGISLGVRVIPYLFMAPLGGLLASRLPRKAIMMAVDLLRIPVALSFLWVNGENRLWLLYAGSFIMAAGEAIYSPVRKSAIPLLAGPDSLLKINSLEQLMTGCVLILGAFTGGVVSLWWGPDMAFIMNAVSFLGAALLIWGIHFPETVVDSRVEQDVSVADEETGLKSKEQGRWQTLKLLVGGSLMLQIVVASELLLPILNGWDNVLISVYAVQVFHAGDIGVGAFYAALGIGLSLSFFAGRLVKRRLLAAALAGLLCEGIILMSISASRHFAVAFVLYILLSLCGGIGNACLDTLVMRETPPEQQPVMFGILSAVSGSLLGVSMFSAGWLLDLVEPRTLGFAGGVGFAGVALLLGGYVLLRSKWRKVPRL
ncbi:MFS transporter [Paenibacillus sp. HW567]|uniref:MFS transporter n=1 Tax=Paenibacillus sp. HW567 TaxID=1034769 RepID=UPI0003A0E2EA|nr:MFS transporter [Paenibacillus sp. HW567]